MSRTVAALFKAFEPKEDPVTNAKYLDLEAIIGLADELGIDLEKDEVLIYVLAWKLNAVQQPLCITEEEWSKGMAAMKVKNEKDLKGRLDALRSEIAIQENFAEVYRFIYGWSKDQKTHKIIKKDVAVNLWKTLLPRQPRGQWKHLDAWLAFVEESPEVKNVTEDLWTQLLLFINDKSTSLEKYDPNAAWPSAIDAFADWYAAKQKK